MFSPEVWGAEIRDVGYLHARAGAAQALLRLGKRERALDVARAELADVETFGAPRALGIALRTAGLAEGGDKGIELLNSSVATLRRSPALLELAPPLAELGAALRRDGRHSAPHASRSLWALDPAAPLWPLDRWRFACARSSKPPPVRARGAVARTGWKR